MLRRKQHTAPPNRGHLAKRAIKYDKVFVVDASV